MKIWVDADACPHDVKQVIFKAAERMGVEAHFVANRTVKLPPSKWIKTHVVGAGMDVADNYIVQHTEEGDLIITADIPLASEIVAKNALVIDPKGEVLDERSIGERLAMRNLMTDLRGAGQVVGGGRPRNNNDTRKFAASFDKHLTSLFKRSSAK